MQKLGFGNIWFHQKWPADNDSYQIPDDNEIQIYLDNLFSKKVKDEKVMIDTANGYGDGICEKKLGDYLKTKNDFINECFISTKFGKELENNTDFSLPTLIKQFNASFENLPKIDLVYIHMIYKSHVGKCVDFFTDNEIVNYIFELKDQKKIKYFGASISNPNTLEYLFNTKLLNKIEYLQIPAWFLENESTEICLKKIYSYGIKIVINSPVRFKRNNSDFEKEYLKLFNNNIIDVVLSGTRFNLESTYSYYYKYLSSLSQYPKCFNIELNLKRYIEFYEINSDLNFLQKKIAEFLKENLKKFKLINICNLPDISKEEIKQLYSYVKGTNESFFKISEDDDNEFIDIIYKKGDESTFKYSNKRQPMHTDYAYNQRDDKQVAGAFMYNLASPSFGGYTTFLDSEKLVAILKEFNNDLYERLIKTIVKFDKDVKFNITKSYKFSKIITKLFNGQHLINWNYYRWSKDNDAEVVSLCEEFHDFMEEYIVNGCYFDLIYSWNVGDCVFWNDSSLIHGRSSFIGSRHLVKSGISL